MQKSFRAMAIRADNAMKAFVEQLMEAGEISEDEAHNVGAFYLKEKIAKLDYGIGRVTVKHGVFWEKDVIQRAANSPR